MGIFDFLKSGKRKKEEKETKGEDKKITPAPEITLGFGHVNVNKDRNSPNNQDKLNVVTFEERKKTCIPSNGGLYVAEILLLDYCSRGEYPNSQKPYPSFWWYEYGIKDVDAALKSLETRQFIHMGKAGESLYALTVSRLKEILKKYGLAVSGKKAELINRIKENIPEEDLLNSGVERRYVLTEKGKKELDENAYVPYMHKCKYKTIEGTEFGKEFNVWSINRLLGRGDKSNWKGIVEREYQELLKQQKESEEREREILESYKDSDPEFYKEMEELKAQDEQIAAVNKAEDKYKEDKDLDAYIAFWENIWENEGMLFYGTKWTFRLTDLYIKAKRYDDALAHVKIVKEKVPVYAYKADQYIERIEKLKSRKKK